MANSLGIELQGKHIIFRTGVLKPEFTGEVFLCTGGFGCSPNTQGRTLAGKFLCYGEEAVFSGYDVGCLATDEEIARYDAEK